MVGWQSAAPDGRLCPTGCKNVRHNHQSVALELRVAEDPSKVTGFVDDAEAAVAIDFGRQRSWERFAILVARGNGEVSCVCPIVPMGAVIGPDLLAELDEDCDDLEESWEEAEDAAILSAQSESQPQPQNAFTSASESSRQAQAWVQNLHKALASRDEEEGEPAAAGSYSRVRQLSKPLQLWSVTLALTKCSVAAFTFLFLF
jgi:hypothetical protein